MPLWRLNVNNRTSFPMRGSRKFFQRGSNFDYVFLLLMMGEMIYFCDFSGGPDSLSPPLDPHMFPTMCPRLQSSI